MTKAAKNSPMGEKVNAQVVDNIELMIPENSPTGKMTSDMEIVGAIKHQNRINQLSGATLIIELARVQASYRSEVKDLKLLSSAGTFKEFVENECGLNYKTITNKISHLKSIGPQMLQLFEQLGVPVTLQRQIKALPDDLRKKLGNALAGSLAETGNDVMEIFKQVTAHVVVLQDKLDESSTKTKVEVIEERDRAVRHYELVEDRMTSLTELRQKDQAKIQKLVASQKPDEKALGLRKINDQMEVFFKTLSEADLSGDDLAILTEKTKFQKLIDRAIDLGLN